MRAFGRYVLCLSVMLAGMALSWTDARAQIYDSAYIARVEDTVRAYMRKHPLRRPSERRFNAVPLYGVMYTEETGVMAMGGFMGRFRTSPDTLVPHSSVGAVAMISVNLSALGAVMGKVYSPSGSFMFEYMLRFDNSPRRFWGIGYEAADIDGNSSSFTARRIRAGLDFMYRSVYGLKAGTFVRYDFYDALDFTSPELIDGYPLRTHYLEAGVRLDYDTRDNPMSPSRGMAVVLEQSAGIPLSGQKLFFRTAFTADFYFSVWKGGVLAADLYGDLSSGGSPWTMWAESGGQIRMRGYYQGRYRDRNLLSAQIELRQQIYGMHGIALWCGAGNVFPSFRDFNIRHTLPTFGAGYRLTVFGIVVRIDAGFGTGGQYAVTAGFNHSF